jgi:hypothetical protein
MLLSGDLSEISVQRIFSLSQERAFALATEDSPASELSQAESQQSDNWRTAGR